jgi:hypothetical protein
MPSDQDEDERDYDKESGDPAVGDGNIRDIAIMLANMRDHGVVAPWDYLGDVGGYE